MFDHAGDIGQRAIAGLCLRCYISKTILVACKKIARTYKSEVEALLFSYLDFLPFVLNDDGSVSQVEESADILNFTV